MKVRMKTGAHGPGLNAQPGEVVEVSDVQGHAFIDGHYAEAVAEVVVEEPPEADEVAVEGGSDDEKASEGQGDADEAPTGEPESASVGPGETAVADTPTPRKRTRKTAPKSEGG